MYLDQEWAGALCRESSCDKKKTKQGLNELDGGLCAEYAGHILFSHFQPIFGLSLQRPVGYEALLRPVTHDRSMVSPAALFDSLNTDQRRHLDGLSHLLHMKNYRKVRQGLHWLFLNMTPECFLQARKAGKDKDFGRLLEKLDFPAQQLVIEVLEEHVRDDADFESAMAYFRELGCLIALDDFGAGSSNFDRVWKIRPQIVKLDRSLIAQSAQNPRIRRLMPQIVSLLHEAGSMVLIEGIETNEEACIALDANADFAQGYLFGKPQADISGNAGSQRVIDELWGLSEKNWRYERQQQKEQLAPYINAIGYASVLLFAGRSMTEACASFLELPLADLCFLLDGEGRQIGENLWSEAARPEQDPRLAPLRDAEGARWVRSPYFRRAIESYGKVQVTRPYLSVACARLCVTVSVSFKLDGRTCVICGDLRCL